MENGIKPQPAPCIVVAGPARSGKTTLLHFLDLALRALPSKPLVYVVKGSPDGTGRYLLHLTKEQREALKERVKGAWSEPTVDSICEWIRNARKYLDLVLLDFGGKRGPAVHANNQRMLQQCSHSIVLAKTFDDPAQEAENGLEVWRSDCREAGLQELAVIDSLWEVGEPEWRDEAGVLRASVRGDKDQPDDTTNSGVIAELAARLERLPQPGRVPQYVDLFRPQGWDAADPYRQMEEVAPLLRRLAVASGPVPLGGNTAIFAYLLAMHTALAANPDTGILIFNPTIAWGLVDIPLLTGERHPEFPYEDLSVELGPFSDGLLLDIRIISRDKFLIPTAAEHLRFAPLPDVAVRGARKVYVTGAAPNWLHAAYSRWLAQMGVVEILVEDKTSGRYIRVNPPDGLSVQAGQ